MPVRRKADMAPVEAIVGRAGAAARGLGFAAAAAGDWRWGGRYWYATGRAGAGAGCGLVNDACRTTGGAWYAGASDTARAVMLGLVHGPAAVIGFAEAVARRVPAARQVGSIAAAAAYGVPPGRGDCWARPGVVQSGAGPAAGAPASAPTGADSHAVWP